MLHGATTPARGARATPVGQVLARDRFYGLELLERVFKTLSAPESKGGIAGLASTTELATRPLFEPLIIAIQLTAAVLVPLRDRRAPVLRERVWSEREGRAELDELRRPPHSSGGRIEIHMLKDRSGAFHRPCSRVRDDLQLLEELLP